jgi:FlaA1/EpsC-like NDP-sugar epimerase
MAEQMIRFYGFEPGADIKIETVGLRAGERLDEKLYGTDETPEPSGEERILIIRKKESARVPLETILERLHPVCFFDPKEPDAYRDAALLRSILRDAMTAPVREEKCA